MTPYQSLRFIDVLYRRKWSMHTATLLREFGLPDLVNRKAPMKEWFYVLTSHIQITGRPCADYAYRVEIRGPKIHFGGCNRLSMSFYEKHSNQRVKWWRLLRPRTAA